MLDAVVSIFDKLTSRPGLRSSLLAVLVFGFAGVCVVAYEATTAHFRLQRLNQTAKLVRTIQDIEKAGLNNSTVAGAHQSLQRGLEAILPDERHPFIGAEPPPIAARETLWKFLAGGTLWWLVSLFALGSFLRKEDGGFTGFIGILVFGIVFGAVGSALPTVYWPWFNLVLYPIGHFVVVLLVIAGFGMDLVRARSVKQHRATPQRQPTSKA